jgi:hypothetical protein
MSLRQQLSGCLSCVSAGCICSCRLRLSSNSYVPACNQLRLSVQQQGTTQQPSLAVHPPHIHLCECIFSAFRYCLLLQRAAWTSTLSCA